MTSSKRYAVYWVPGAKHPLWLAGCTWLGVDPLDQSRSRSARQHIVAPRRYGFHATLKAPTRLVEGVSADEFIEAVRSIATSTPPFEMPRLAVGKLANFVALRPVAASSALQALAARCVVELDRFRAPFTEQEWAYRTKGLDAEQQASTLRLGYHHVLEDWRFHMTLSDPFGSHACDVDAEKQLATEARAHFTSALDVALGSGDLGVFVSPRGDAPFVLEHRIVLDG